MEWLRAHPLLTALLLVAGPLGCAIPLGRALRRRGRWRHAAGPLGAAVLALAWAALPATEALSPYDVLWVAALFAAGLAVSAWSVVAGVPRATWAVTAGLLVVGVGALEAWARALPPPPMALPPPSQQMVTITRQYREYGTAALFPDSYGPPWLPGVHDAASLTAPERRVLHLGDSMVVAGDVPPGAGFVDVLTRERGERHVNLGVSNSGTDLHLALFRRWQPRLRGVAVVLHIFSGNDVDEMDRPYRYCGGGPLLGPRSAGMPLRCPTPRWDLTRRALLAQGPSPYVLRMLAWRSALARQATWRVELVMRDLRVRDAQGSGDRRARLRRLAEAVTTLREEAERARIPLLVSVLPFHTMIDAPDDRQHREIAADFAALVAAVRATGVRTVEPLADLTAAVHARPRDRWFLPPSPHFDVDGHRWYARWIASQLSP